MYLQSMVYNQGMIRRQIYLDEKLCDDLHRAAARKRRSASALIREAVARYLEEGAGVSDDPIRRFIGGSSGGSKDAAAEHDRYLYGSDR